MGFKPQLKPGLNPTFPGGFIPHFLLLFARFDDYFLLGNVGIRPDYRRSWDIPVSNVDILPRGDYSRFRTVLSVPYRIIVGLGQKLTGIFFTFLTFPAQKVPILPP